MAKNPGQMAKRRTQRTERRRVEQERRKEAARRQQAAASRASRGRKPLLELSEGGSDADGPGPMRLTDHFFTLVPESVWDGAADRCLQRAERCESIDSLPPGFHIRETEHGGWQLDPPPEYQDALVSATTHALPELAMAYAWEVVEGKHDFDGVKQVARGVVDRLIEQGDVPSGRPEYDMMANMLGFVLAGELLTGYRAVKYKYGRELGV